MHRYMYVRQILYDKKIKNLTLTFWIVRSSVISFVIHQTYLEDNCFLFASLHRNAIAALPLSCCDCVSARFVLYVSVPLCWQNSIVHRVRSTVPSFIAMHPRSFIEMAVCKIHTPEVFADQRRRTRSHDPPPYSVENRWREFESHLLAYATSLSFSANPRASFNFYKVSSISEYYVTRHPVRTRTKDHGAEQFWNKSSLEERRAFIHIKHDGYSDNRCNDVASTRKRWSSPD